MTKFESVGINRQYASENKREANEAFQHSCNCCCHKGIHIDCDKCAIEYVHNMVVAYFDQHGNGNASRKGNAKGKGVCNYA